MPETDEKALLEQSRNGDMAAFEELYRPISAIVVGAIRGILRNSPDVEDVAREVFLKAFKSIHMFRGQSKLSSWLHAIAVRASIDHLRKARPHLHESLDEPNAEAERLELSPGGRIKRNGNDDGYSPYHASENEEAHLKEHAEILNKLLKESDPKHAEVIRLCHLEGRDAKEAARIAGLDSASQVYEITKHYSRRCLKAKRELEQARAIRRAANKSR